jgi:hypothetical protein
MDNTPENILQQEILRERAEVLGRAGASVDQALERLRRLASSIERRCSALEGMGDRPLFSSGNLDRSSRSAIIAEINREIAAYNQLREYACLRYHYLIITREALGLRGHHRVEELYAIPPKKKAIQES